MLICEPQTAALKWIHGAPKPRDENEAGGFPMTIEQVRSFYDAQPFQPFVIHLGDGRQHAIASREFMMTSPTGRTIGVYQADGTANIIDLLLVTDLELRPAGNGARRRKR
jgi:hypothetical protein